MIDNYEDIAEFNDVRTRFKQICEEHQDIVKRKIKEYFLVGRDEHIKLFQRWVRMEQNGLAFLAVFSEPPTGQLVAQCILGLPLCVNPQKIQFTDGTWKCKELVVQNDVHNF
jgi:hypothetical protein